MKEVQNGQLFQEIDDEVAVNYRGGVVYLYDNVFSGRRVVVSNSVSDLRKLNFNDKTSSIRIVGNERWAFYKDINFKNPMFIGSGPSAYSLLGKANNSISSLRRIT